MHGFDEFFGNLYHLNAEEEPEHPDYPKDPRFRERFGPRGVLKSKATDRDDPTIDRGSERSANRPLRTLVRSVESAWRQSTTKPLMQQSISTDAPPLPGEEARIVLDHSITVFIIRHAALAAHGRAHMRDGMHSRRIHPNEKWLVSLRNQCLLDVGEFRWKVGKRISDGIDW